jgi:SPP1 gp7 family putative phage head morphogenesis protein
MPVNYRAAHTAGRIRVMQSIGLAKKPRKRIPRQIEPRAIEREYQRTLIGVMQQVIATFDDLKHELPGLLASAARDHRLDAGEGSRVRQLIEEARRKMNSSILTPELDRIARKFAERTASHQRVELNKQVKAALGVDVFLTDRRLVLLVEAFVNSNVGLIKKLGDEVAGRVETSVLRAVQDAKPWDQFATELQDQFDFGETRAKIIARDQIGKMYGQTNAARQRELGVTRFRWNTSNDERVRPEHAVLDGKVFSYNDPPSEGLPGEPILCRCVAEPLFDGILEEV